MNQKSENPLRTALRRQRAELNQTDLTRAAERLDDNLARWLAGKRPFDLAAAYIACNGEIDPSMAVQRLRSSGSRTCLPVMNGQQLLFAPWDEHSRMVDGQFDIPVPAHDPAELISPSALDLVLVPLVAFDARGNRMGMGGGFYDRSFDFCHPDRYNPGQARPVLVGVAHEFQRVEALQPETWDVPMQVIITDQAIHEPPAEPAD